MSTNENNSVSPADRELERLVSAALSDRHFPTIGRLQVEAVHGGVTLRGRVGSFYEKQLALHRAAKVPGVLRLRASIEVVIKERPTVPRAPISAVRLISTSFEVALIGLILFTACNKAPDDRLPVFPVSGQVTFQGQSPEGAFVVFHPKAATPNSPRPSGYVDKAGNLKLNTYSAGDGAPAGDYAVTVEWRKLVVKGADAETGPNVLPSKYSSPKTTTLQARVVEGPNDLPRITILR